MSKDLEVQIVLSALDLATKDIDGVNAKIKELSKTLTESEFTRAAGSMSSFGDAVKESTQPMADAAKTALGLGAAVAGLASVLAGRVYQSAVEYESATADLSKVMDGGAEAAAVYGDKLNQLASQYGQNGQELLSSMTNFVQAGYSAEEAFRLVEESVKLMIAGELDAGESSANLVSILKGFGAPASEAAHAVDLLNAVSNKYATDVQQLSIGMAALSPIARQMGFSMDETAGLLTPVIEVFRSGSEAADALKTGLQKLTDDAAPVRAALESIGVSQTDANGALRSGKDIFLDVSRAFVGLNDNQKQFITSQLVGIDQAGRMSTVFSDMGKYLDITATASGSAGSALKEVEVRLQTAEVQSKRAEESFRQLSVTLGNQFKPEIAGVIGATGDLAKAFESAVAAGDLAPLFNALKPQIAAIETLFRAMAGNLEEALSGVEWQPLVDGIKAVSSEFGEAFATLSNGIDLTTVEGLRTLLDGVVVLLGKLLQWIGGVVDGIAPLMAALNGLFGIITTNAPNLARLIGQMEGLALSANQVIPFITGIGSAIFGVIGSIVDFTLKVGLAITALKLLQAAGVPIGPIFNSIGTALARLGPFLLTAAAQLTGLTAVLKTAGAAAAAIIFYEFGQWLRDAGVEALYAAEQGTLAAHAFELLATEAEAAQLHLNEIGSKTAERLKAVSDATGIAFNSMHAFNKAVEDGTIVFDKATQSWQKGVDAKSGVAAAAEKELSAFERLQQMLSSLGHTYDENTGEIVRQTGALSANADELTDQSGHVDEYRTALEATRAEMAAFRAAQSQGVTAAEELVLVQERLKTIQEDMNKTQNMSIPVAGKLAQEIDTLTARETELTKQLDAGVTATTALQAAKTREEGQLKKLSEALSDLVAKRKAEQDAAERTTGAIEAEGNLRTTHLGNLASEARARGDVVGAVQLEQAALESEIDTLTASLAAKQAEVVAAQNAAAAKLQEADADGLRDQADLEAIATTNEAVAAKQREVAATQEAVRAKRKEADAARDLAQQQDVVTTGQTDWQSGAKKSADASRDLAEGNRVVEQSFEQIMEAAGAAAVATGQYADVAQEAFEQVLATWKGGGLDAKGYMLAFQDLQDRAVAAASAAARYAEQIDTVASRQDLANQRYSAGVTGLSEYIAELEKARYNLEMLGDADLSDLNAAIAEAKQEMADFADGAIDGLKSLQQEWADLNGQQIDAMLLEQQMERFQIETELAQAKKDNNAEAIAALQAQLDLLDQIHAKQLASLAEEEAQKAIADAEDAAREAARWTNLSAEEQKNETALSTLEDQLAKAILARDELTKQSILNQIAAENVRHAQAMENLRLEQQATADKAAAEQKAAADNQAAEQKAAADNQAAAQKAAAAQQAASAQQSSAQQASASTQTVAVPAQVVKTVQMNFTLPSGSTAKVNVLPGQEDTLTGVLNNLFAAKAVAA